MNHEPLQPTNPLPPTPGQIPEQDTQVVQPTTPGGSDPNRTVDHVPAADVPSVFPEIPGFNILNELGRGGMGVVYKARQTGLDRTVALKMILKADFATPEQKLRFQIEAENAARVQHPNIVQVFEVGDYKGQPFFALEFVDGGSLADWIKSHRMKPGEAAAFVETLARAMFAAHSQGIIHRDLKPGNILMASLGRESGETTPKITDFGLAKRLDQTEDLTGSHAVMGTPNYMSPEQARGQTRYVGPAADQYSLGVIFYQLLTGEVPFRADAYGELLLRIVEEEPRSPRQINPDVPLDLAVICLKCLEKDPARRYDSTEALADDLKNWREHRPIQARPATRLERAVKWCRRYPAVAALILVSTLAALVASGLAWWAVHAEAAAVANAELAKASEKVAENRLVQVEAEKKNVEAEKRKVEEEKQIATAVRDFLQHRLLAQLDPTEQANRLLALGQREEAGDPDPKLSVLLSRAAAELAPDKIEENFPKQPLLQAALLQTVGDTYRAIGGKDNDRYALAISFLERATKLWEMHLGADHPNTLGSMNSLANAFYSAGKLDRAVPLWEGTLRLQKAKLGPDHPDTITSMNNLAHGYHSAGRLDLALPLWEETLRLRKVKLGPDHPDTITSMNNLAVGNRAAGKLDQALSLSEDTLRLTKAKLGPNHPYALASMNDLAEAYRAAGKLDKALPLHEETLRLTKAKLGPDHPNTLASMSNLALCYQTAGKLDQALPLLEETLRFRKAKLGPDHPDTLTSMNNLASAYRGAGKLDLALPLFEETLRLRKAKLGPDHPDTLQSMNNLAEGNRAAGKLELTLPLYEETLRLSKAKLGPDHPDTLTSMGNLAGGYAAAGQLDKAVPLYEETLRLMRAKLGPDHPSTFTTMNNLALSYREAGKLDLALPLHEEELRLCKAKLGPDHPDTLKTMINIALCYQAAGKLEQALPLYEESLRLMRAKLGPDHPDTLKTMINLALCYQAAGKLEQALPLNEESLPLMRAKLGPDHPDTLKNMNNLAVGYYSAGKLDQALPLLEETLRLRQAKLGPNHPDTLTSMGNLGAAFCAAKQVDKAAPILQAFVTGQRQRLPKDDLRFAGLLARVALDLLRCEKFATAEEMLRESLAIREKKEPEAWTTFNTMSMLGGALLWQKKYAEAEPLLLKGYEGIKARLPQSPGADAPRLAMQQRLTEALDRLIELYTALEKPEEVKKWQEEKAKLK